MISLFLQSKQVYGLANEAFIPKYQQPHLLAVRWMHCFGWKFRRACKSTNINISTSQHQGL